MTNQFHFLAHKHSLKKVILPLPKPTHLTFHCCKCMRELRRGFDVSRFYHLESECKVTILFECVFCWNKTARYPVPISECYKWAYHLQHFGVACCYEDERFFGEDYDE